jgi:hypothetical protein
MSSIYVHRCMIVAFSVYDFEEWCEIFPFIKSSICTKVWFGNSLISEEKNRFPNVIREIAHISFDLLKVLCIGKINFIIRFQSDHFY